MSFYEYIAVNERGQRIKGVLEAENSELALLHLQRRNLIVTKLKKKWLITRPKFKKPKLAEIVNFSRQLSALLRAKVPLEQALETIEQQIINPPFKKLIQNVRTDVTSGLSLSEALQKHQSSFSELYVGMVRAGEATGKLSQILTQLSRYLDAQSRLKRKVIAALRYPMIVLSVAFIALLIFIVLFIPQLQNIYGKLSAELPNITRIMILISQVLKGFFLTFPTNVIFFSIILIIILILTQYSRTERGKFSLDSILLKLPLIGQYLRKVIFARFSRTLSTLIANGVPILEAFDIVSKTVGSKPIEEHIIKARERIKEGEKIAEALRKCQEMPPILIQMINVGEQTGKLDEVLDELSQFYEEEVDITTAAITSMMEPLLIVFLGGIIGLLVISFYLPIFKMYRTIVIKRGV